MTDKGWYEWDLADLISNAIDMYQQDRKSHWCHNGWGDDVVFEHAEGFAKAVTNGSETLVAPCLSDERLRTLETELKYIQNWREAFGRKVLEITSNSRLSGQEMAHLIQDLYKTMNRPDVEDEESPLRLVWERLMIEIAWDVPTRITDGATRMLELYALALKTKPSSGTMAFLGRLGRCYIWGFDPECVILCRSVMDTAFRETVSDEVCEKHLGKKRDRRQQFHLDDRIKAACKEGILTKDRETLANNVKDRGNKAVHYQPGITKDVLGTIYDTVVVLNDLLGQG